MNYIPINCEFHDHLEVFASARKPVVIHYQDEAQQAHQVEAVIQDVYAREGADYIALSTGEIIRADRLIAVNGIRLDSYPATCAL